MVGGRPKPSPCLKLFSFLYPKSLLPATVTLDDKIKTYVAPIFDQKVEKDQVISYFQVEKVASYIQPGIKKSEFWSSFQAWLEYQTFNNRTGLHWTISLLFYSLFLLWSFKNPVRIPSLQISPPPPPIQALSLYALMQCSFVSHTYICKPFSLPTPMYENEQK